MRIDYEPDRGESSLTLRAFRDEIWLGSAHVSPRVIRRQGQLQKVIDVLTLRGSQARELSMRLRAVDDDTGTVAWVVGETEAAFRWPRDEPEADSRRDALKTDATKAGHAEHGEHAERAERAEHAEHAEQQRPVLAAGEGAAPATAPDATPANPLPVSPPCPTASERPSDAAWWPPGDSSLGTSSEGFAWRAEVELERPRRMSTPTKGNVLVRLPNGATLVLPSAPCESADLGDRAVATTIQLAYSVRRHAEDLLAAAESIRLATTDVLPSFDLSVCAIWLRASQRLQSRPLDAAGSG